MDAPLVVLHQVLVYQNPHLVLEKGKMGMDHQLAQCPLEHLKHEQLQSPNGLCYKKITVETSESYYKWKTMVVNIYSQFSDTSLMADDQKMNVELPATSQEINHHITLTEAQSTIPTSLTAVSQGDNDAQHAPTSISDADQDGSEQEEAQFLLEVTQAQHLVCSIEQELAKVKLQENIALGELYKFCAEEAEWRLEIAEFELGCMCNSMRNGTVALDDEPSDHKHHSHIFMHI
ncbi:hypothetical protein EDC04DRAFT_2610684 [Pisolithus marmoratus]|nr:hypothetical protein EDC04DRAFT_2610684 [Pisolithus marmoratus]